MHYEVFLPAAQNEDFDVTLTIEADNWMTALKAGLERCGQNSQVRSVMCDIKEDNTIHITDASSRRVFKLRELTAEEAIAQIDSGAPGESDTPSIEINPNARPGIHDPSSTLVITESQELSRQDKAHARAIRAAVSARQGGDQDTWIAEAEPATGPQIAQPIEEPSHITLEATSIKDTDPSLAPNSEDGEDNAPRAPIAAPPEPARDPLNTRELKLRRNAQSAPPTMMEMPAVEGDLRDVPKPYLAGKAQEMAMRYGKRAQLGFKPNEAKVLNEALTRSQELRARGIGRQEELEQVVETAVEDVFLEIYDLFEGDMTMERAIDFILDLAMRSIKPESGSVLFATSDGRSLRFAAARGPKASEVLSFTVPMEAGIVGFCTREGVSLAVSDVQNDPRYFSEISEQLGYPARCIICAPFEHEGRVYGCIELINKKGAESFQVNDANALTYIGKQMGQFIHQTLSNIG